MSLRLPARDRRAILLGAVLLGGALIGGRGIPAWVRWERDTSASAAEAMDREARARADVRGLEASLDSLEARRARLEALAPALLDGGSPAASGASLAALLSGAAARSGVTLGAVRMRADSARGTFSRVRVDADATGTLAGLARMIALLEGGPELLAVRSLSLAPSDPSAAAGAPGPLRMEIVVEGLALGPGDAP